MKKRFEKEDKLISEIMKDFQMENPSEGFTDRVMQQIEVQDNLKSVTASPLISKKAWIGIAASLTALVLYLYFGYEGQATAESGWLANALSSITLPSLDIASSNFLSKFNFESPALFWIFLGTVVIISLTIMERFIESSKDRNFLFI